jgi:hypothetical protein
MGKQVLFHAPLGGKSLVANGTHKRPISVVHHEVYLQVVLGTISLGANRAGEDHCAFKRLVAKSHVRDTNKKIPLRYISASAGGLESCGGCSQVNGTNSTTVKYERRSVIFLHKVYVPVYREIKLEHAKTRLLLRTNTSTKNNR